MRRIELILHVFQGLVWLDEGLQARLHDRGWPDVSRSQSMVMINIVTGVTRPSDIARRLGISRQAIHTTIAQMVGLGIVSLEADPSDGRHKRLRLSAFGERMRNDAQASMEAMVDTLSARLGSDRFEALLDALAADWGPLSTGRDGDQTMPRRFNSATASGS